MHAYSKFILLDTLTDADNRATVSPVASLAYFHAVRYISQIPGNYFIFVYYYFYSLHYSEASDTISFK